MRILVVDDDDALRGAFCFMLGPLGYEVETCANGRDAWDRLQAPDAPRLVLLDWQIPAPDGPEICRRIQKWPQQRRPYVLMLTGLSAREYVIEGLEAGADDYLAKPADPAELIARLAVGRRIIDLQDSLAQRVIELENALAHVRTLQGILPICMHCHRIGNSEEMWVRIEKYISDHSDARFSHGICPDCCREYYPGLDLS